MNYKTVSPIVSLEVCANSVTSAVAAQDGGAVRVELCENLLEGGTTPSYGEILMARKLLHIKLYVLIRPRGGDFLYTDLEFNVMMADIRYCIEAGCDGIVIGILNPDGTIDRKRCAEMINLARQWGLGVTFHRAFDMCADLFTAMEEIIDMGCERILTSGGKSTAMEGASNIARLVSKAAGRIKIMPGSGVNENNVADLVRFTGVTEVHSSARVHLSSKMEYKNDHIVMGDSVGDEYAVDVTGVERVKSIIQAANSVL
ncbi:copper homeostasis protein CutC [Mucilaginibacter sp. L3T2-6]|uniref:copper homeostasis protein CutC n=1 Tax=Mucilaginibacter sp. L3T2-6 TaxID=3062491 RepID=UPI0026761D36|nr:copper homeostasis protein CutC [Mucilaginibacter sp. L3T2-6]MDO3645164.1 copper homeostasis protein CutC [Mucilaginibacter sp. L3T2-6]MDV6217636.1 copper homeostasis protein CutC [Mucilaginibacter sp. L3T2-6]